MQRRPAFTRWPLSPGARRSHESHSTARRKIISLPDGSTWARGCRANLFRDCNGSTARRARRTAMVRPRRGGWHYFLCADRSRRREAEHRSKPQNRENPVRSALLRERSKCSASTRLRRTRSASKPIARIMRPSTSSSRAKTVRWGAGVVRQGILGRGKRCGNRPCSTA
jgi:hypothetical protein